MNKDKPVLLAENVVMVPYHDTTALPAPGMISAISDPTETVQVEGFSSEAMEETPWLHIKSLFGAWVENGDEAEDLDELYRSRLTPSSMPHNGE